MSKVIVVTSSGGVPADRLRQHWRAADRSHQPGSSPRPDHQGRHQLGDGAFDFEGGATDPFGNQRIGFEGSASISRKDYGITWNAALETGGLLFSDKIVLELAVSAIRNT